MNKTNNLLWIKARLDRIEGGDIEISDRDMTIEMFRFIINVMLDKELFEK